MKGFRFRKKSRAQRDDPGLQRDEKGVLKPQDGTRESLERTVEDEVSRQRRIEGDALLAERLQRLARLDEARAVDAGLVSHAEYQLYLDERRAAGEARQPDHWLDVQFPWGEGSAPVVGVRYFDALAFCEWLTGRDRDGWRYRLPRVGEPNLDDVPRSVGVELPPGGGYWVTVAGGGGRLVRASNRACTLRGADLAAWIERDLTAGRDLYVESALARGRGLAGTLGLDPDLDRAEARELAVSLVDTLDRVLERARDVDRRLVDALEQAVDRAQRIGYALDGGGARDLGEVVDHAHDVDRALAVAHYRTRAIPRAQRLARAMSRAIDCSRELNVSVARVGVSDVVRILLLTGNRTSAVDRAHVLAKDVVHDLAPAADLAADLQFAHALGRVRELDLALMLLRACDVSRPFDLDRLLDGGSFLEHDRRGDDLAREISRLHAVLHDPDLDHAGAHALDRPSARALERTLARDLDLVRALARCAELARAQVLTRAGAGSLDLSRALEWLVERGLSDRAAAEWKELSRSLRQFVRFGALACAIELGALLQSPPDLWVEQSMEARGPSGTWQDELEAQRDIALDVYIQLGILEDRIEGHLPAWEGIRIVGERGLADQGLGNWGTGELGS